MADELAVLQQLIDLSNQEGAEDPFGAIFGANPLGGVLPPPLDSAGNPVAPDRGDVKDTINTSQDIMQMLTDPYVGLFSGATANPEAFEPIASYEPYENIEQLNAYNSALGSGNEEDLRYAVAAHIDGGGSPETAYALVNKIINDPEHPLYQAYSGQLSRKIVKQGEGLDGNPIYGESDFPDVDYVRTMAQEFEKAKNSLPVASFTDPATGHTDTKSGINPETKLPYGLDRDPSTGVISRVSYEDSPATQMLKDAGFSHRPGDEYSVDRLIGMLGGSVEDRHTALDNAAPAQQRADNAVRNARAVSEASRQYGDPESLQSQFNPMIGDLPVGGLQAQPSGVQGGGWNVDPNDEQMENFRLLVGDDPAFDEYFAQYDETGVAPDAIGEAPSEAGGSGLFDQVVGAMGAIPGLGVPGLGGMTGGDLAGAVPAGAKDAVMGGLGGLDELMGFVNSLDPSRTSTGDGVTGPLGRLFGKREATEQERSRFSPASGERPTNLQYRMQNRPNPYKKGLGSVRRDREQAINDATQARNAERSQKLRDDQYRKFLGQMAAAGHTPFKDELAQRQAGLRGLGFL